MTSPRRPSRRTFLTQSAALAALRGRAWPGLALAEPPLPQASPPSAAAPSGTHALRPLLEGETARPRRYAPEGDGFLIRNGRATFNRPLYAASEFAGKGVRVDAGDRPEFRLWLPGEGGRLRLGVARDALALWLFEFTEITTHFRPGRVRYELRDRAVLGRGSLVVELQTSGVSAGFAIAVYPAELSPGALLVWAFGGASGRLSGEQRTSASVAETPPLAPEDCNQNRYILGNERAELRSPAGRLRMQFPMSASLHLAKAERWREGWAGLAQAAPPDEPRPVLAGSVSLPTTAVAGLYLSIDVLPDELNGTQGQAKAPEDAQAAAAATEGARRFADRARALDLLAASLRVTTPDPYLAPAVAALPIAADALWDAAHTRLVDEADGRTPSPGWRGPHALDAMGRHDRMRAHLRHWLARQNTAALPPGLNGDEEMRAPADPGSHLTRKESLLHTNGDLSASRRDRNLLFFDALVRHLRWNGDAAFAREIWPALLRHMDWEYRLFRRLFPTPGATGTESKALPLYEGYACIPTGEDMQGNGGGAAHATAYNYFLNRGTAAIARLINEDASPFDEEAALIAEAMERLLWLQDRGAFAEARDLAYPGALLANPALWTVSSILDAELPTERQAWQICTERLAVLRPMPISGADVPEGGHLLPSSEWMPPVPSLTALDTAENAQFALALWQAGLPDEAYALLRGVLLDSMYQSLCPGGFPVVSALDPQRGQEPPIDSGDTLGTVARAVVEGLFGVLPDLMRGTLTVRPGFPSGWDTATLAHPEIDFTWSREGSHETLVLTSRLPHPVALTLILPAPVTADPVVLSNGVAFPFTFDANATGAPRLVLTNFPPATAWQIDIRWRGKTSRPRVPAKATYSLGEPLVLPKGIVAASLDDPQDALRAGLTHRPGHHAVFARIVQEKCGYWLPIPFEVVPVSVTVSSTTAADAAPHYEPVDLAHVLDRGITDLLQRSYTEPRSPFCSLALPEHLLGSWSNDNVRFVVDDAGLRNAGGTLKTAYDVPFVTPSDRARPNCRLLSFWNGDSQTIELSLTGRAHTLYALMTGTTFAQASRVEHGAIVVTYTDGSQSRLSLRTPETWWPVEQDYFTDDYLFPIDGNRPLPPRIDLRTGRTRLLDHRSFKGKGGPIPGGAATLLHLSLDPDRDLRSVRFECSLYGVVLALLGITLGR